MTKKIAAAVAAAALLVSCAAAEPDRSVGETTTSEPEYTAPAESDTSAAESSSEAVSEDIPEEDLTPIYDFQPIVEAYLSGDASGLSERDSEIYSAAVKAIGSFYSEGMTEEEIVLAAHDWLVTNVTYDSKMLLPIPKQSPDSENPYGTLINGEGICMGYTSTFQMFMEMLGVKCGIVRGVALDEEHAWNTVEIGGKLYNIDVTWDDFIPDEPGRQAFHMYSLVPDSVMRVEHIWDESSTPPADNDDLIYYKSRGLYAESKSEVAEILKAAYQSGAATAEVMTPESGILSFYNVSEYWEIELGSYTVTIYWFKEAG